EFMQDKIGNEYEGNISGLTEWGMYVEIKPTMIEGMVALRDVKSDFFEFDEQNYLIKGRRTGKIFRLGDPVKIRVKAANLEQRLLDYELVDASIDNGSGDASGNGSADGKAKKKPFYAAVAHNDNRPGRKSSKDKGRPRKKFGPKSSKGEKKKAR
ncbi:MAG TPA: hypothetical protein DDX40_10800, partial [Rikenellaceae bacterium]|nr:hypothetical protein [Rikenellaceae bacterium]